MDIIITFFRDILDGSLYIIVAVISGILICSCIGYLAEQSLNKKKQIENHTEEHLNVEKSQKTQTTNSPPISTQNLSNSPVKEIVEPNMGNQTILNQPNIPVNSMSINQAQNFNISSNNTNNIQNQGNNLR